MTTIALIVAAADNNVIGKDNAMPWHIPEDFRHFKTITMGKPCIMGRKTFESIVAQLGKPLPGRTSIVISRSTPPSLNPSPPGGRESEGTGPNREGGPIYVPSIQQALAIAQQDSPKEIMIIGGAQIYAQALAQNLVDKIYLTRVHQSPEGDAHFPALSDEWIETAREDHDGYCFLELTKK